ncbi:hypothetical protein MRX96_058284 [Rhipicephalus microplus]
MASTWLPAQQNNIIAVHHWDHGTRDDPSYEVPAPTNAMPLHPDHDARALNPMGIASTWLPAHTKQHNCCTWGYETILYTMYQHRQTRCPFNPCHDACPLNWMGFASTWLPAQKEQ